MLRIYAGDVRRRQFSPDTVVITILPVTKRFGLNPVRAIRIDWKVAKWRNGSSGVLPRGAGV